MIQNNKTFFEKKILAQYLVPKYFLRFKFKGTRPVYGVDANNNVLHYNSKTKKVIGTSFISKTGMLKHSQNGTLKVPCILPINQINHANNLTKYSNILDILTVKNLVFKKLFLLSPVRGGYLACSAGVIGFVPDYDLLNFTLGVFEDSESSYKISCKLKNISCTSELVSEQLRQIRSPYRSEYMSKRGHNIVFSISSVGRIKGYNNEIGAALQNIKNRSQILMRYVDWFVILGKKVSFLKLNKKSLKQGSNLSKLILLALISKKRIRNKNLKFYKLFCYTYKSFYLEYKKRSKNSITALKK